MNALKNAIEIILIAAKKVDEITVYKLGINKN